MNLGKQSTHSNFDAKASDNTFKLLQDIHDGNEAREKLNSKALNSVSATLYLARELNFLQDVASASGHEMTSQFLYQLHIELLQSTSMEFLRSKVQLS